MTSLASGASVPVVAMLTADEIRWSSDPIARVEDVDLLTLTHAELFERAQAMQRELRALRALLSASLARDIALTVDPASVHRRDRQVVEELRPRLVATWMRSSEAR